MEPGWCDPNDGTAPLEGGILALSRAVNESLEIGHGGAGEIERGVLGGL